MDRIVIFVMGESAVGFGALSLWNFQTVAQLDRCDAEQLIVTFNAALDVGFQIVCCGDSTRFQRAGKCAGQSTSECGDDVIDGRG